LLLLLLLLLFVLLLFVLQLLAVVGGLLELLLVLLQDAATSGADICFGDVGDSLQPANSAATIRIELPIIFMQSSISTVCGASRGALTLSAASGAVS
jgi:hypothetical protein